MSREEELDIDAAQPATTNTTESKVGKIDGKGHQITQAATIINQFTYNFTNGSLTNGFKGAMHIPDEESDDQNNLDAHTPDLNDAFISSADKIIEEIAASSNDATFINTSRARTRTNSDLLPHNSKEIESWYYQELNDGERCFVKACAVLHGATLRAIGEATKELYTAQKDGSRENVQTVSSGEEPPSTLPPQMPETLLWVYERGQQTERARAMRAQISRRENERKPTETEAIPLHSLDTLLERTYTYAAYTNGATRIFWKDTNLGLSNFSIELLRFLAREAAMEEMFGPQAGLRFLDIVKQWPEKFRGERSWRSANALGVIWWHQDAKNLLWRQADKWAKSQQKQDWEHAAALLDGAYQVERLTLKPDANGNINSSVLQLLDRWTATAHKWITTTHQPPVKRGEGYAAARAYALIGRKSPEVALQGLEQLLHFPPRQQSTAKTGRDPAEDLFISGVIKYADIARAGHIRQILKHLANDVELHIRRQGSSRIKRGIDKNAEQSASALHVILTAFILVTSCSLSGVDSNVAATYHPSEHLPKYPICPDNNGKDILLAGILTTAEPLWREQLITLLASIIFEKNYPAAFYLMIRWGEIVLKDESEDAPAFEDAYVQFLVKVGQQILAWSTEQGATRLIALGTYERKLTLWQTDRRLPHPRFRDLAHRVLKGLAQNR